MLAVVLTSALLAPSHQDKEATAAFERKRAALSDRVFTVLVASGFVVKRRGENSATVSLDGTSAIVYVNPAWPADPEHAGQLNIATNQGFQSPVLVDKRKISDWLKAQDKALEVQPQTRIDGFTFLRISCYLPETSSDAELAMKTRALWAAATDFSRTVLPEDNKLVANMYAPFGKPLVDDYYEISESLEGDLAVLTKEWGWEYKKGHGGSGAGWSLPLTIDGFDLWLSGWRSGTEAQRKKIFISCNFGNAAWGDYWSSHPPKLSWARVEATPGYAPYLRSEIDLSTPKTVKAIREAIAAFARHAAELVEKSPVNPPAEPPSAG